MKMKKKEIIVTSLAVIVCLGAWFFKPSYFQQDDGIIYAKTYEKDTKGTNLYNLSLQEEANKNVEKLKSSQTYTEDDPLLIYNPYGTNTLSMYSYFTTTQAAIVSYTIHVADPTLADFTRTLNSTYTNTHESQVIGLLPDMENTITFHITYEDGTTKDVIETYTVGSLLGSEEVLLNKSEGSSTEEVSDGLYVILGNDSSEEDFMYFYDNNGILRGEIPIEGYRSHRLLLKGDKMYFSYSTSNIAEMNNLGQITNTYDLGNYVLHHDYVFDDDGNILLLATDTTKSTVEDRIVKLDLATGKTSLVLDLGTLLADYKKTITPAEELDWVHLNTIQWMGNEQLLISSRETSTILKISDIYTTPKIDYMLAEPSYWENTTYADLLFDKEGTFASQTGQHSITYVADDSLEEGQYYLYMFNNNYGKSSTNEDYDWSQIDDCITDNKDKTAVSKYYKYLVDEHAGTYSLVDSFDVPFSSYVSSAQNIEDTTVIDSGTKKNFQEYDSDHNLIQSFDIEAETFIYRVYKYDFNGFYFHK